ncbi:hypothetical protein OSB04_008322 [Centaurea solstitialis]|uniref:Uncharacterized protein n=1 Tax=Centaurea solstitialis TaxID=347529 RepID=A0AA38WJC9_9ASTR|nr:hypothetical protein OSB04_008322 [Centaurea solstitialis]
MRTGFPAIQPDFQVHKGHGAESTLDFEKSLRSKKVLQGQEIFGYNHDSYHHHCPTRIIGPFSNNHGNCVGIDYDETFRSNQVLQGQEIFSEPHYPRVYNNSMCLSPFIQPSSVLPFHNAMCQTPYFHPDCVTQDLETPNLGRVYSGLVPGPFARIDFNFCKLFGFSLTDSPSQRSSIYVKSTSILGNEREEMRLKRPIVEGKVHLDFGQTTSLAIFTES